MQLQDVGVERLDHAGQQRVVGVDGERDDPRPAARFVPSARAAARPMLRGLLGKTTKPTMSAPAASAASSAAGVERPQILTRGVIAASFGQTARAVKGATSFAHGEKVARSAG